VSDTSSDTDTSQGDAPERPFLRIVKGNPSPAEIAALVTVVASARGSGDEQDTGPRNLWGTPTDRLRAAGGLAPSAFPNLAFGY
jgi:hypothetical protein